MQLSTPIIIEDEEYPLVLVSLSINAMPTADGGTVLAYVRRLVPARVVEGVLQQRQDQATSVLFQGPPESNPHLLAAETYLKTLF